MPPPNSALFPAMVVFVIDTLLLSIATVPALRAEDSPWPNVGEGLVPDPAWTYGRLENGLRYAVRRNVQPAGHVSFRFAVQVGFANESKEERGFAHVVEHLAAGIDVLRQQVEGDEAVSS